MARRRAAEEAARKSEQSGQPQAKKKRKRKVRHPKDFDPANPGPMPHPERWLPKWQRSDFKKRRKTRKEKQVCRRTLHLHDDAMGRTAVLLRGLSDAGTQRYTACNCMLSMYVRKIYLHFRLV